MGVGKYAGKVQNEELNGVSGQLSKLLLIKTLAVGVYSPKRSSWTKRITTGSGHDICYHIFC